VFLSSQALKNTDLYDVFVGYFDLKRLSDGSCTKPGMRGYPGLDPMQELMLEVVQDMDLGGIETVIDLAARGGAVALELQRRGLDVHASDPSAAACLALWKTGIDSHTDFDNPVDMICTILSADRGNALVRQELWVACNWTRNGGICLIVGDKDRGFDRYFKEARVIFGEGEILERSRGLRVARLVKTRLEKISLPKPSKTAREHFFVDARGQSLLCAAFPGTFSSGKLDPASKLLLEHLPHGSGRRLLGPEEANLGFTGRHVLDIGAGYGVLGGFLALEGASVTMLESDLMSVHSCTKTIDLNHLNFPEFETLDEAYERARRNPNLKHRVLFSDVDSVLDPSEKFDLIVSNPPFHVGSDLILDVALEFIRCAERRLTPGGEFWLVANHFLPYEREMARIGVVREVARERGFKVLTVKKPG
jgi:16S rRNA (guanine1207-N2)-methyltransferase